MPETLTSVQERRIYRWFEVGILLKGCIAFFEMLGGALLFLVSPAWVQTIIDRFTNEELGEDPYDIIANGLRHLTDLYASTGHTFAAFYLLSHGIIKFFLIVALLLNKPWAYPASLGVFGLFFLYQVYIFFLEYSLPMGVIAVFDIVVIWLIWREWRVVKAHRAPERE